MKLRDVYGFLSRVQAQARPETFIPIVGGADAHSSVARFTFGPGGTMQAYSTTSSKIGTGSGLASGPTAGRAENQPRVAR